MLFKSSGNVRRTFSESWIYYCKENLPGKQNGNWEDQAPECFRNQKQTFQECSGNIVSWVSCEQNRDHMHCHIYNIYNVTANYSICRIQYGGL